jgi:uncharacterized damage-inducible protein DinB
LNTIDSKVLLRDGFKYDLYSNQLWLPRIIESGGKSEHTIFQHILSASQIWIIRFGGDSPKAAPEVELSDVALLALFGAWLDFVDDYDYDQQIDYTNLRGMPASGVFGDIAHQVLNHGTYHRGQLREKFGSQGLDFPETDFLLYAATRSLE